MGYAHGTLLKDAIQAVIPAFYHHLEEEVEQYIKFLPLDIRDLIAELGLDGALDLTHLLTREYAQLSCNTVVLYCHAWSSSI